MSKTAQEQFDQTYITSSEICKELHISRAAIVQGRERGLLPEPIAVNNGQLMLWERDIARKYIDAWKLVLRAKRGALAA